MSETALAPGSTFPLLIGLGLATGMEFYTFDSVNLVLTDLTGTLGVSADEASWLLISACDACSVFAMWGVVIHLMPRDTQVPQLRLHAQMLDMHGVAGKGLA